MENIKGYLKNYKREVAKFNYDLEVGQIYQDLVMYTLSEVYKVNINPLIWSSRYFQMKLGEGIEGIEIKKADADRCKGNIFIACYERGNKPTGIMSNSKYYAIGTYKYFYMFKTDVLRDIYNTITTGKSLKGIRLYNNKGLKGFIIEKWLLDIKSIDYRGTLETNKPIKFSIFSPL